jgi:hypothetical protein
MTKEEYAKLYSEKYDYVDFEQLRDRLSSYRVNLMFPNDDFPKKAQSLINEIQRHIDTYNKMVNLRKTID